MQRTPTLLPREQPACPFRIQFGYKNGINGKTSTAMPTTAEPMSDYLPGIPDDVAAGLKAAIQRPTGSFVYWGEYPELLTRSSHAGTLLQLVGGSVVVKLVREADFTVRFLHASPGTGTREAAVHLEDLILDEPCTRFFFALVWSREDMRLHLGRADGKKLLAGVGGAAPYTLRVDRTGVVHQIGSGAVQVSSARVYAGGSTILSPSAIELWTEVKQAVETLLTGTSTVGYIFEAVISNAVHTVLVTGFETYCQQRFTELETEGVKGDFSALVDAFLSREERDRFAQGEPLDLEIRARAKGESRQALLAAERINFQSYDSSKKAFRVGYGVRFGEIPAITSRDLEQVQRLISFRHRIIHVSPMLGMLNGPSVPPEEPYFSNRALASQALALFDRFILALHAQTLGLEPLNNDATTLA